ncbi:MAG: GHMP kinase [Oligoflexia bacterium]|nr:GHMP kinase [Oligoflexia bacterium]
MCRTQNFYGHGKLLLTGEYFVLDGALGLALPATVGQMLNVKYRPSFTTHLDWKSFTSSNEIWFHAKYDLWHFDIIEMDVPQAQTQAQAQNQAQTQAQAEVLQRVLRQARIQNPHFLREREDISVEMRLEFPINWGLGASSTLIYNVAQWAHIEPFELLSKTMGGSGYDVACAQASGPIIYQRTESGGQEWSHVDFNPSFKDNLYFVYSGNKQSTAEAISQYKSANNNREKNKSIIEEIDEITKELAVTKSFIYFKKLIAEHEDICSKFLEREKVKNLFLKDFSGEVKSLGAWGGDFWLVASDMTPSDTTNYFYQRDFKTVIPYCELVYYAESNKSESKFKG